MTDNREGYTAELLRELHGMNVEATETFPFVIYATTDDPATLVRIIVTTRVVTLVQVTNGMAGVGAASATLDDVPAMVAAAIVAGWVEALGVNLGPGAR